MKLIDFESLPAAPWKNGGGITRELACHPPGASFDDFAWRVSVADVHESGAFSTFAGIDRIIALLDGDGMDLQFEDGRTHALTSACAPFRFRGEDRLHAQLTGGPSRDINLMLRRDVVDGAMEVRRNGGELISENGFVLLFCARGKWEVHDTQGRHHNLALRQALVGEHSGTPIALAPLEPDSILLCMQLTMLNQDRAVSN